MPARLPRDSTGWPGFFRPPTITMTRRVNAERIINAAVNLMRSTNGQKCRSVLWEVQDGGFAEFGLS